MIIKYNETKKDRESGLYHLNKIKNIYGSRFLFLLLAIAVGIVAVLEVIYNIHIIGIGYLGILASVIAIWILGINRYLEVRRFNMDGNILYTLDLEENIVAVKNKNYLIKSYYDFNNIFLIEYEKGYVSLSKIKLDDNVLKQLNISKDI